MLVEVRTLPRKKGNYIRQLLNTGKIQAYVSEKGYIAYDTDDLEKYQKSVHRGRPIKIVKGVKNVQVLQKDIREEGSIQ